VQLGVVGDLMRIVGFVVGVVLFCWATVSAFSIFEHLKFLVDGWTWSVDQVPITIKSVALMIGKYVSDIVGHYREFVHGLVQMMHLPRLPQFAYDVLGIISFSCGRGISVREKVSSKLRTFRTATPEYEKEENERFPIYMYMLRLQAHTHMWRWLASIIVYGGLVAATITALFAIDFLYRHFA
jgi:hypothetical protein